MAQPGISVLESPSRFKDECEGGGSYVGKIEEAIKNKVIDLRYVQKHFKDYKNSECARANTCFRLLKGGNRHPEKECIRLAEYFCNPDYTTTLSAEQLIKFWFHFDDIRGKCFDCDGSDRDTMPGETAELYSMLWPELVCRDDKPDDEAVSWDKRRHAFIDPLLGTAGGDTMNSFKTTYKAYENKKDSKPESLTELMAMLAYLTHTAGNFIPMPRCSNPSINTTHEYYGGNADRWDWFMVDIDMWYKRREWRKNHWDNRHAHATGLHDGQYPPGLDYIGKKDKGDTGEPYLLFAENPDHVAYKWLEHFECFDGFVRGNYLDDYYDGETRRVITYDEGAEGGELSLRELLVKMNARIIARGFRMREEYLKRYVQPEFVFGS